MQDSLAIGISGSARHLVTPDMSPAHLPHKVLSTPSMVQLIEMTCLTTAQAHLDDGETTVGVHICVSHSASVAAGEEVEVRCELTERDRRRLTFVTTVTCGDRVVSEGTHQRFVLDTSNVRSLL
jgi:fluoroacetyl-CoA thioesterase